MSKCPRCHGPLAGCEFEGTTVEMCGRCGGQWLGPEDLRALIDARNAAWSQKDLEAFRHPGLQGVPLADLREDLPCPSCGETMTAFNYGGDSGIILDRCPACGGIWLDGGELDKVQMAVAASDENLDRDVKRFSGTLREVAAREDALENRDNRATNSPLVSAVANRILYID